MNCDCLKNLTPAEEMDHERSDYGEPHDRTDDCIVDCDKLCRALLDPKTPEEVFRAYEHWRRHSRLSGCSHGC